MALTLEQLSKNKKENKLNYNSENKALPFSSLKIDEESAKKGELTKPISSIERVDRNLKRIQEKTDRILERTEKAQQSEIEKNHIANESLTSHQHVDNTSPTDRQQKRSGESKKTASTVEL